MKKKYMQPSIVLVETEMGEQILAGSDNFSDKLDNNGVNSGQITSKPQRPGTLWDESWEDEEEND